MTNPRRLAGRPGEAGLAAVPGLVLLLVLLPPRVSAGDGRLAARRLLREL